MSMRVILKYTQNTRLWSGWAKQSLHNIKMCSENIKFKNFDALYATICNNLRESSGESIRALEEISKANSDYNRIAWVLQSDPNLISFFSSNIAPNFLSKNEAKAVDLLRDACSQNSLPLINQALQLCNWELGQEEVNKRKDDHFLSPLNVRDQVNLKKFISLTQKPDKDAESDSSESTSSSSSGIIAEIFARRSAILFQFGKFESCIRDTFRSANYGPRTKTYEIVLRLALSYKHLGHLPEAKHVAEHALDVLRSSRVIDNEAKSKETVRLVAIIKEIQQQSQLSVPSSPSVSSSKKSSNSGGSSDHHKEKEKGGTGSSKGQETIKCKLFENPDNVLVATSSALELKFSKERGRHVIAKRDIPPGSTLIIEHPFAWSVTPSKYPSVCQNCLESEPSSSDGIPCPDCAAVIFCNEECRDQAMKSFHRYECKILNLLDSSEKLGKMALLCFRTVVSVPWEEILATHDNFLAESKSKKLSPSNNALMGFNSQGKLDSSDYASVFAQTTNSSLRNGGDLLKRTYASIYLVLCLRLVGYHVKVKTGNSQGQGHYNAESELSETEIVLASILLRHLQSVSCNAYGVNHVVPPTTPSDKGSNSGRRELEIEEIGGATYPMISTTNHSCSPNIYRFNVGKVCVVNSLSEIKAGQEIFDSYGPLCSTTPVKNRQSELEGQYCFHCGCIACLNNWPTFSQLNNPPMGQGQSSFAPAYQCPHCDPGSGGHIPVDAVKDKRKCPNCGKLVDFKKLAKSVKSAEEKYKRAKECVLKQKLESPSSLEKCICNYIQTIQRIRVLPTKEFVEAQEVLKLLWNLLVCNDILHVSKSN